MSALVDGRSYRFVSRATDLAGNTEFAASTAPVGVGVTVTYDPNAPTAYYSSFIGGWSVMMTGRWRA